MSSIPFFPPTGGGGGGVLFFATFPKESKITPQVHEQVGTRTFHTYVTWNQRHWCQITVKAKMGAYLMRWLQSCSANKHQQYKINIKHSYVARAHSLYFVVPSLCTTMRSTCNVLRVLLHQSNDCKCTCIPSLIPRVSCSGPHTRAWERDYRIPCYLKLQCTCSHDQLMNHISINKCYAQSPTAEDRFQPISGFISCMHVHVLLLLLYYNVHVLLLCKIQSSAAVRTLSPIIKLH